MLKKKSVVDNIAVDLHENYDDVQSIQNQNPEDENQGFFLGYQIKWLLKKKNIYIKYVGNMSFFFEQMLIIWGIVLFFSNQECCKKFTILTYYKIGVIICGFYQYFEVYLIPTVIILAIPIILIYFTANKLYQAINKCMLKRQIL